MNLRVSKHRGESAHSLPEAIFAALILGTMLISLYAGISSGFSIVRSTQEELRASQILLERVETLRLYTWAQLHDSNKYLGPTFTEYFNPSGLADQTAGTVYAGHIFTNRPASLHPAIAYRTNLLEITVKVYWTNGTGSEAVLRSKQMQTYVARYGMQNYSP